MKPLIVGEAPSKNEDTPRPIEGRIGRRLADCAGLPLEEFLAFFDRTNLLQVRQDTKEKGFTFDHRQAAVNAAALRKTFVEGQIVLLLGRRVARAFGLRLELFVAQNVNGATIYVLPHPSGISRWWNDPDNVKKMMDFMRQIIQEVKYQTVREAMNACS